MVDYDTLQFALRGVQARYEWKPNALVYKGGADFWPGPSDIDYEGEHVKGDCKVHTLLCRHALRKLGIDSRIMICLTGQGGVHCVLEVDGWIMDNLHRDVMPRDKLPYNWIERSGVHAGDEWHLIQAAVP